MHIAIYRDKSPFFLETRFQTSGMQAISDH